ncbi:ABC transporter ATP-binding protein [Hahella sp. HN01]|uniref:ABC transporter ATP-binding protein n=1 Tax=Hahella sp. HN01 TaxID=2847262 RepID=UPI001C1F1C81|nr:ABC transporter ATP-binding protein [Hahella sp. HN01]MBU6955630.1 ABC transporter ATP-binding protein [Hahella sp. HN01]
MIHLEGVSQYYGRHQVLHDLNLTLGEGEVLGLFGHNGAGKTTTIKLILGLLRPDRGNVLTLGRSPNQVDMRRQIGYLPENVMFYPQLSGLETLRYFARLKQAPLTQVKSLLEQVGLSEAANQKVKTYSKGMRQRLGLAQALLGEPRLLLLDEPTVGLDPIATADLYELVDGLRRQGAGIILCSHVLPGVEPHIDRAAILGHGRLRAEGSLGELRRQAQAPIRLRLSGVKHRDQCLERWKDQIPDMRPVNAHSLEIATDAQHKLELLKVLLTSIQVEDVDIHQPGLEDLYRYFIADDPAQIKETQQ